MRRYNKQQQISASFGKDMRIIIKDLYLDNMMSSIEIVDYIKQNTQIDITARSIQRLLKGMGITRSVKNAFNNAIKRNRVHWQYKELKYRRTRLSSKLRYKILKRDNFKCVLCGNTAKTNILEVDHIIPISRGGSNDDDNLRTSCNACNKGKQYNEDCKK